MPAPSDDITATYTSPGVPSIWTMHVTSRAESTSTTRMSVASRGRRF